MLRAQNIVRCKVVLIEVAAALIETVSTSEFQGYRA